MVWKYGRKVIDALFKRWAKRAPVCARLATQREADCDRSHIRVFEAGLSSQRSGNHQQSTRDAQKEVGKELIAVAKQQGLYISKNEWVAFGERKRVPSGESIVFFDNQQGQVIKVRDPFAKALKGSIKAEKKCALDKALDDIEAGRIQKYPDFESFKKEMLEL